jgi:arrestin-related trafficking adapter 3/6
MVHLFHFYRTNSDREDQLRYEILISGKAFPVNGTIPIAFKFTPLAKVRLHRIKVLLTENIEYHCRDKKVHRREPLRKILLFEKQAQKPRENSSQGVVGQESDFMFQNLSGVTESGARALPPASSPLRPRELPRVVLSSVTRHAQTRNNTSAYSLLGNLEGGDASGTSTEFEVDVPLPGCQPVRTPLDPGIKNSPHISFRCHHTTIWPNIVVHHWIKIILRVSKADETPGSKNKRRHFEISIDSPIHLLSVTSHFRTIYSNFSVVHNQMRFVRNTLIQPQFQFQEQT